MNRIAFLRNKLPIAILLVAVTSLTACDKFLDRMPDNRAEVDTNEKVGQLLVSAYPNIEPMYIYHYRTDDVMDNGRNFGNPDITCVQSYNWEKVTDTEWDGPEAIWRSFYRAIASSNQAIEQMELIGRSSENDPHMGEALITRAYSHFVLANTFCKPYDPSTATSDMGIPYITEVEKTIGNESPRGTLQETYDKIAKDIEDGFPLINDALYKSPKYHFNRKATAAFAAKFYLFKGEWQKAIDYANIAIGSGNPSASLRDLDDITKLASNDEWRDQFVNKDVACNLMLVSLRSLYGRNFYSIQRYSTSATKMGSELYNSAGPWGKSLSKYALQWGVSGKPTKYWPKYLESFEITNKTAQTGQPHVTSFPFTVDETLLIRAEAEIWLKDYDEAAQDLSYYFVNAGGNAASVDEIVAYYTQKREQEEAESNDPDNPLSPWLRTVKDISSPFGIEAGTQEAMLQSVLHTRRIELLYSGARWLDIRRYNIEVVHNHDEAEPQTLVPGDSRYAFQIPDAIISAGMEPNPQ